MRLPRLIVHGLAVVLFLVSVSAQGCTDGALTSTSKTSAEQFPSSSLTQGAPLSTTTAPAAGHYAAAPPPPPESTATMKFAYTGTVKTKDPTAALAGVLVTATNGTTVVAQTTTGTDGMYALYVPAGTYTLTFSLATYQSQTTKELAGGPGDVTTDVDLVRLSAYTGKVTTNHPTAVLAGVLVTATNGTTVVAQTTTGTDGMYALYVPAGTYNLTFSLATYQSQTTKELAGGPGDVTTDVDLDRLSAYTGKVTTNHPTAVLAGVLVTATNGTTVVAQTTTGTDGMYALYVPAGTYTLTFSLANYQSRTFNQLAVSPANVTKNVDLDRLSAYTGKVTTNHPTAVLAGVLVTATNGTTVVAQTTTGTDGMYALYVPAGTYTLTFSLANYQSRTFNQLAVSPANVTKNVDLDRLSAYTGKVTTNHPTAVLAGVLVTATNGTTVVAQTTTGTDGMYALYVPAGTYALTFSLATYQSQTTKELAVSPANVTKNVDLNRLVSP